MNQMVLFLLEAEMKSCREGFNQILGSMMLLSLCCYFSITRVFIEHDIGYSFHLWKCRYTSFPEVS